MNICFVYGGHENLGIEYLSAILKRAGHRVKLAFDPMLFNDAYIRVPILNNFFDYQKILLEEILSWQPDLAAFSVVTDDYQRSCQIAARIKREREGLPIIFGGIHPTSLPEKVISQPFVDIVCIGEGEYPILELTNGMEKRGIDNCFDTKNLWFKRGREIIKNEVRPLIQDLDALPFADKDIFFEKTPYFRKIYTIMTSRGCPYKCTFCCNDTIARLYKGKGRLLRQRSVDNVILELTEMKEKWHFKTATFYDDIFAINKDWLVDFCAKYKKLIDLPFRCIMHPRFVDEERIVYLKEAGCVNIELGIQSVNQTSRQKVLKRYESNAELEKTIGVIKDAKIGFSVDHILGIPYEDEEDQIQAARFYNNMRPDLIDTFWMTYYPKTKIVDTAIEAGLLTEEEKTELEEGRGTSHAYSNRTNSNKIFYPFQFLFGYLPFLPKRIVKYVIEKRLYRFFRFNSLLLSTVLPRFIHAFLWNDYNARNQTKRNFYLLLYVLLKKLSLKKKVRS